MKSFGNFLAGSAIVASIFATLYLLISWMGSLLIEYAPWAFTLLINRPDDAYLLGGSLFQKQNFTAGMQAACGLAMTASMVLAIVVLAIAFFHASRALGAWATGKVSLAFSFSKS